MSNCILRKTLLFLYKIFLKKLKYALERCNRKKMFCKTKSKTQEKQVKTDFIYEMEHYKESDKF